MPDPLVAYTNDAGEVVALYTPTDRQLALHTCPAPNVFYGGAAGPGKSHSLRWHCVLACLQHPNFRALLLRRQFIELETTHILALRTELPKAVARYEPSRHRVLFKNGSILQMGHCSTDDDFRQYLSTEWGLIAVDEAGDFTAWMLEMLPSRLRSTDRAVLPQYVLASNPGGIGHHWLKSHFIDKDWPGDTYQRHAYAFLPAVVGDNPHLPAWYVDRLKALPEAERKAYFEGDWNAFVGQVFREWNPTVHVLPEDWTLPGHWAVSCGLDWGYRNPSCLLVLAQSPKGDLVATDELYFTGWTGRDAGARIGTMLRPYPRALIYGDEQMWYNTGLYEHTIADEFQAGLADAQSTWSLVPATHGPHSRLPKLNLAHYALAWSQGPDGTTVPPRLRVHPRCKNLIRTLPALGYDKIKLEDVDRNGDNHCLAGHTPILTDRGWVPIASLDAARVTRYDAETVILEANEWQLQCTPDHLVLTPDGWCPASQLRAGQQILWWSPLRCKPMGGFTGISVRPPGRTWSEHAARGPLPVSDISTDGYGVTPSAQFQQATIYTTATEIRLTTGWPTSTLSSRDDILPSTVLVPRHALEPPEAAMQRDPVEMAIAASLAHNAVVRLRKVGSGGKLAMAWDVGVEHDFHGFVAAGGFVAHNCYDALCCWLTSNPVAGLAPPPPPDPDRHPGFLVGDTGLSRKPRGGTLPPRPGFEEIGGV